MFTKKNYEIMENRFFEMKISFEKLIDNEKYKEMLTELDFFILGIISTTLIEANELENIFEEILILRNLRENETIGDKEYFNSIYEKINKKLSENILVRKNSNETEMISSENNEENLNKKTNNFLNENQIYKNEIDIETKRLIEQLNKEDQDYLEKKRLENLLKEEKNQNCNICFEELFIKELYPVEGCEHIFHRECIKEYVTNKINDNEIEIKCPNDKCKGDILPEDFKKEIGPKIMEKYYNFSFTSYADRNADEVSWCPTPDCQFAFIRDENEDENNFKCPKCRKQVEYHVKQTCKEFQISNKRDENDIKFEKFVKGKKFKQCTKCKFWVEKNHGCDHMVCRCKYEFCYKCGGQFGHCECMQNLQLNVSNRRNNNNVNRSKRKSRKK